MRTSYRTLWQLCLPITVLVGAARLARADAPPPEPACKYTAEVKVEARQRVKGVRDGNGCGDPGYHVYCSGDPFPKIEEQQGALVTAGQVTVRGTCRFGFHLKDRGIRGTLTRDKTTWLVDLGDADPATFDATYHEEKKNDVTGDHTETTMPTPRAAEGSLDHEGRGGLTVRGTIKEHRTISFWVKEVGSAVPLPDPDGTPQFACDTITCTRKDQELRTERSDAGVDFGAGLTVTPTLDEIEKNIRGNEPFTITAKSSGDGDGGGSEGVRTTITLTIEIGPQSCGPDITAALEATVTKLKHAWYDPAALGGDDHADLRKRVCDAFIDPMTAWRGWDFYGMHDSQEWTECEGKCAPSKGAWCAGTVAVKGQCFYAGSVNYISIGVFAKLCAQEGNLLNADSFQNYVYLWKVYYPQTVLPDKASANFKTARGWAQAGFDGWPNAPTPDGDRSHCEQRCHEPFSKWYALKCDPPTIPNVPGTLLLKLVLALGYGSACL